MKMISKQKKKRKENSQRTKDFLPGEVEFFVLLMSIPKALKGCILPGDNTANFFGRQK